MEASCEPQLRARAGLLVGPPSFVLFIAYPWLEKPVWAEVSGRMERRR